MNLNDPDDENVNYLKQIGDSLNHVKMQQW